MSSATASTGSLLNNPAALVDEAGVLVAWRRKMHVLAVRRFFGDVQADEIKRIVWTFLPTQAQDLEWASVLQEVRLRGLELSKHEEHNSDVTIVMAAVRQDGLALKYVSQEMKGDRELCMAAVAQEWQALRWASEEMKGDRELCMAAVAQDGTALRWASEEMKGDRDLCMAAVAQDGEALQWASQEMKGDLELCMAAVAQNALALEDVPDEMKNDETVAIAAVKSYRKRYGQLDANHYFYNRLHANMRSNLRVREAAGL